MSTIGQLWHPIWLLWWTVIGVPIHAVLKGLLALLNGNPIVFNGMALHEEAQLPVRQGEPAGGPLTSAADIAVRPARNQSDSRTSRMACLRVAGSSRCR